MNTVADIVIQNESSGPGLPVRVSIDTLGCVIIELGLSITVRTDSCSAMELADALSTAAQDVDDMRRFEAQERAHLDKTYGEHEREVANDPTTW